MSVSRPALSQGPEFCDPPPIPVSRYVREYASYSDPLRLTDMRASNLAMTIPDRHNALCDTEVRTWVKRWLHCRGLGMSVSPCIRSEVECPFVR